MATRSSAADDTGDRTLHVNGSLDIPRAELTARATRASGAGGQHVNKTSTRVELTWNVAESPSLTDEQRARLLARLASRLSETGELRVVASDTRSQAQNRELAELRLAEIVRRALVVPKVRRATKPSRAAREARLSEKRHNSERKRERRRGADD
jgi:ribosome-associated protein